MAFNKKEWSAEYRKKYIKTPIGRALSLISAYNTSDKKYNRGKGDLTPKWIVDNIFTKPCAHCGEADWHKLCCNRIDNSKPHTMDNVEPCCFHCNCQIAERVKKTVYQYTLDGELVAIYSSVAEAARASGVARI